MNYEHDLNQLMSRGIHCDLGPMQAALKELNDPQTTYPSIHVAGTNGKGSTLAHLAAILTCAGYKVGLTTSPHLVDVRERICINNQLIPAANMQRIHDGLKSQLSHLSLTYFEWILLIAFSYFAEEKIDVALVETGMGGRWDATNVLQPLLGAITNVSLDHQQYLGDSLEKILAEKQEILKPGMKAWTGIEDEELYQQLQKYCETKHIPLKRVQDYLRIQNQEFCFDQLNGLKTNMAGTHQIKNAGLALGLALSLKHDFGWDLSEDNCREGLTQVKWPGRWETLSQKPHVIIDGAHNLAGIETLIELLKKTPDQPHLVFACLNDRPALEMINLLKPYVNSITWGHFKDPRGFNRKDLKPLLDATDSMTVLELDSKNWNEFLDRQNPQDKILVAGSLHLIGKIKQLMNERNAS